MQYIDEIKKIKKSVDESDIVSFDIFDTLLLRNVVNPEDIFKIVELDYYYKYNNKINFYEERVKAEEAARKRSKLEDITLDEIYEVLGENFSKEIVENTKRIEIEIEEKFLVANKFIKEVYDYAKTLGKKIILISDMYLPKNILQRYLHLNNYYGYDQLYVSSEINKTKATGTIYSYIKKELDINKSKKWIHIGDNYISDFKNANNNGVSGIYYKRLLDREDKIKVNNLSDSIICATQINMKYSLKGTDYWKEFGISYVAPIYIGLMFNMKKWLKGKDNIYFLSRDGYLPYKLYNKLKKIYKDLPDGKYIYASRRAYIYPSLLYDKERAIDFLTIYNGSFGQELTLKEILKNIELCEEAYSTVLKVHNFNDINEIITDKNITQIKKILTDLWPYIEKALQEEKKILIKYLEQEGVIAHDYINIFDIGWAGSTHKAMKQLLNNKKIYGYYFGTTEFIDETIKKESKGYAFNEGKPAKIGKFIIDNVMMYELLFTAPEGSLKKFKDMDGNIVPELKDTQDNFAYTCIKTFQDSAINVFDEILKYSMYIDEPSKEFALNSMKVFIEDKKAKDLIQFAKIDNVVSIGESEDSKQYVLQLDDEEYIENRSYYKEEALKKLWRGSILIRDNQDRIFNDSEFDKLFGINNNSDIFLKIKKIGRLIRQAIKNPQKAFTKCIRILRKFI